MIRITRKRLFIGTLYSVVTLSLAFTFFCLLQVAGKKKAFAWGRAFFGGRYFQSERTLGWTLIPNIEVHAPRGALLFKTDRFGFRNAESSLPPSGKVMLLGSAAVQGYYLSGAETINEQLNSKIGGYVYNFGVGGYSVDQHFIVGRAALAKFKTETVVWIVGLHDLLNLGRDRAWGMRKPYFDSSVNARFSDRLIRVGNAPDRGEPFTSAATGDPEIEIFAGGYLTQRWELFKMSFRSNLLFWQPAPFLKEPPFELLSLRPESNVYTQEAALRADWERAFILVGEMQTLVNARGARLVLYLLPEAAQVLSGDEKLFAPQRAFEKFCETFKIRCVEPHREFIREQREHDLYFRDTADLSPAGAVYVAGSIAESLTP